VALCERFMENPGFRRLLRNAIEWAGRRR